MRCIIIARHNGIPVVVAGGDIAQCSKSKSLTRIELFPDGEGRQKAFTVQSIDHLDCMYYSNIFCSLLIATVEQRTRGNLQYAWIKVQ